MHRDALFGLLTSIAASSIFGCTSVAPISSTPEAELGVIELCRDRIEQIAGFRALDQSRFVTILMVDDQDSIEVMFSETPILGDGSSKIAYVANQCSFHESYQQDGEGLELTVITGGERATVIDGLYELKGFVDPPGTNWEQEYRVIEYRWKPNSEPKFLQRRNMPMKDYPGLVG